MYINVIICLVFMLLSINGYAQNSEQPSSPAPSIESMLRPVEPEPSEIADYVVISEIMGFPFKLDDVDIEVESALRSFRNSDRGLLYSTVLKFYHEDNLSNHRRKNFIANKINENYKAAKNLPLQGKLHMSALQTKESGIDIAELISAFLVAAKFGEITDIIPYLEFSNVHFGDFEAAFGFQGVVLSISQSSQNYSLTPEQRLHFWPAANAILKNPEKTIPLLQEVVLNEKLQEYLRLRAASFLNTFDASYLSDEIVKQCNPEFQAKIECLKQKNIKWRHPIDNICSNDSRRFQKRDEITRKKLNLPENTDVSHINDEREHRIWGKY